VTRHWASRCLLSQPPIAEAASIHASRLICAALDNLTSDCKAQNAGRSGLPGRPSFSYLSQFFDGTSPFTPALAGVVDGVRVLAPLITSSTRRRVGRLAVHIPTAAAQKPSGLPAVHRVGDALALFAARRRIPLMRRCGCAHSVCGSRTMPYHVARSVIARTTPPRGGAISNNG